MAIGAPEPLPLKVALAEFAVLKQEINQRSRAQLVLFILNITAAGAIGSFALARELPSAPIDDPGRSAVWLILPLLSPVLGMMWLDHHRNIAQIGNYIRECIWATITAAGVGPPVVRFPEGYEGYVDDVERSGSWLFFLAMAASLVSAFMFVPGIALAFGWPLGWLFSFEGWRTASDTYDRLLSVAWGLGVAFTFFWCVLFWLFFFWPYLTARSSQDQGSASPAKGG